MLAFPLPGFAVFGDAFQEAAEVVVLGVEAVEGGAVDFGVALARDYKFISVDISH